MKCPHCQRTRCLYCDAESSNDICVGCVSIIKKSETYKIIVNEVLLKANTRKKPGRKKGTPQSQETKDKIRQALLARHASNA